MRDAFWRPISGSNLAAILSKRKKKVANIACLLVTLSRKYTNQNAQYCVQHLEPQLCVGRPMRKLYISSVKLPDRHSWRKQSNHGSAMRFCMVSSLKKLSESGLSLQKMSRISCAVTVDLAPGGMNRADEAGIGGNCCMSPNIMKFKPGLCLCS